MSNSRSYNKLLSEVNDNIDITTVVDPIMDTKNVEKTVGEDISPDQVIDDETSSNVTTTSSIDEIMTNAKVIVDNTGTTVVKPNLNTKMPSNMVQTAKSFSDTTDEDVRASQLNKLITTYLEFNAGDIMRTKADTERASMLFVSVLKFVLEQPTVPVLNELYKFFMSHRDKVLAPTYVQIGINRTIDKREAEKLVCLYTMFRMMTGQSKSINTSMLRSMLGTLSSDKIDMLVMYYDQKMRNV